MLTNLKQEITPQQNEALSTEVFIKKIDLILPVCGQELITRLQKNKNLPCVCEQLPHHCIQLCMLS